MIISFKQIDGKENVFKHIFQGYILPKDKQSKISMTGYNVENSLGKRREISRHYPYSGVCIIEQETFSIGLQMFLLKIGVSQTCFEIALTWSSSKVGRWNTRDPSGKNYKTSHPISSWRKKIG